MTATKWNDIVKPYWKKELIAVEKYTLDSDEGIILKKDDVAYNETSSYAHELILTNKNIIVVVKGFLGRTKNVVYLPLNQIKVVNNKVQVLVGKHKDGTARLEIYLANGDTAYFSFDTLTRIEVTKWANAIIKLLSNEEENGYNPSAYAISGTEVIAETIKGTVDTFKSVFGKKTVSEVNELRRTVFCQNCGASYEGIRGRTGKCPYCGTVQNIN